MPATDQQEPAPGPIYLGPVTPASSGGAPPPAAPSPDSQPPPANPGQPISLGPVTNVSQAALRQNGSSLPADPNTSLDPEVINAAMHDPGSDFWPGDDQLRAVYNYEKNKSFGEDVGDFASGAWEGAKGIAKQAKDAGGELIQPSNWSRVPGSVLEAGIRGATQTSDLARRLSSKVYDTVRDIGASDETKFRHFADRVRSNLISERALAAGLDKKGNFSPEMIRDNPLPGVSAFGANFLDPATMATMGGAAALEGPAKAALRKGAALVPGGTKALEVAGAIKNLPGKIAEKIPEAMEAIGGAIKKVAGWPEEKVQELAGRYVPGGEAGVKVLTTGAAAAGLTGHGGVVGTVAAPLKVGQVAGGALEQTGAFLKHLQDTAKDSMVPRLLQMAQDPNSPLWIKTVAQRMHDAGVGAAAKFAGDMGSSALHGAEVGTALGLASSESPEEAGQAAGQGLGQGALGRGTRKVFGLDARAGDYERFMQHLIDQGATPEVIQKIQDTPALMAAAMQSGQARALFHKNLNFQFLGAEDYAKATGADGAGSSAATSPDGKTILVNVDTVNSVPHELGHAILKATGADGEARLAIDSMFTPDEVNKIGTEYAARQIDARLKNQAPGAAPATPAERDAMIAARVNELNTQHGGNKWIYDEIYAESAYGGLLGKDLARAVSDPSVFRRLGDAARGKFLAALGVNVDADTGAKLPEGALFSDPKIYGPDLRKMVFQHLRQVYENGIAGRGGAESREGAPQGVPVPKDIYGTHPSVPMEPNPATGRLENDAAVKNPQTGEVTLRKPSEVRLIERTRQRSVREAILKQPAAPAGAPVEETRPRISNTGDRDVSGTKIVDQLPATFGEGARKNAALAEKLMGTGGVLDAWYQAIGTGARGSWSRDVRSRLGNIAAAQVKLSPFLFKVSKEGNVLVTGLSLTAAERKLARWQAENKLQLWDGDPAKFQADLMTYLKNHAENRPGADGIGENKRNALNLFVIGKNKQFATLNPLRSTASGQERQGIVRSLRLDRMANAEPAKETGWFPEYSKKVFNLRPDEGGIGEPSRQYSPERPGISDNENEISEIRALRLRAVKEVQNKLVAEKAEREGLTTVENRIDDDNPAFHYVDVYNPEAKGSWMVYEENGQWRGENNGSLTSEVSSKERAIADAKERIFDEINSSRGAFGNNLHNSGSVAPIFEHFQIPQEAEQSGWYRTKWGSWYDDVSLDNGESWLKLSVRDHEATRKDMGLPDFSAEVSKEWHPAEVGDALTRLEKKLASRSRQSIVEGWNQPGRKTEAPGNAGVVEKSNLPPERPVAVNAPPRSMPRGQSGEPDIPARTNSTRTNGGNRDRERSLPPIAAKVSGNTGENNMPRESEGQSAPTGEATTAKTSEPFARPESGTPESLSSRTRKSNADLESGKARPQRQFQYSPEREGGKREPNEEVRKVAGDYMKSAGIKAAPFHGYEPVDPERAKALADAYEAAAHDPKNPEVAASYKALADETREQWLAVTRAGVVMEPWKQEGQPYRNSAEMRADATKNKHLWFFPTERGFGEDVLNNDNPLLEPTGLSVKGTPLTVNDLFRAVHDYFGHAKEGYEFGPRGEYNAYLAHSRMFSEEARPAMAAETLGQNSWVNFGRHLRDEAGNIPKAGEPGHVPVLERPYAEQKTINLPKELVDKATNAGQEKGMRFSPERAEQHPTEIVHEDKAGLYGSRYLWAVVDGHPWKIRIADHDAGQSSAPPLPEISNARKEQLRKAATLPNDNAFNLNWMTDEPKKVTFNEVVNVILRHVADEFYKHEDARFGGGVEVKSGWKSYPDSVEVEGGHEKTAEYGASKPADSHDQPATAPKTSGTGRSSEAGVGESRMVGSATNKTPNIGKVNKQFSPEREAATEEAEKPATPWYSQLQKVIDQKMPARAAVGHVLNIIDPAKSAGVKADEVRATGLKDWLGKQSGSVNKEQVMDYLRQNAPNIHEITHEEESGAQKYNDYRLPGGHNYQELLFTLPDLKSTAYHLWQDYLAKVRQDYGEDFKFSELPSPVRERLLMLHRDAASGAGTVFQSQHWEESNVLGHVRFDERFDGKGHTALHIEEVQSDWHQTGRKGSYYPLMTKGDLARYKELSEKDSLSYEDEKEMRRLGGEFRASRRRYSPNVPEAPFQKSWPELFMKRMILKAAEGGYEKITWTTGDQQADRYRLDEGSDEARGMEGFYDKILPDFMNKFGKPFGVKVTTARLPDVQVGAVHSFDIPPAMREKVLQEGLPMFSPERPAAAAQPKEGEDRLDALARYGQKLLNARGGFTVSLAGTVPKSGYLFSEARGHEQTVPLEDYTAQATKLYLLDHFNELNQQDRYLGAWVSEDRHEPGRQVVYLDVSTSSDDRNDALARAKRADQLAVFDVGRMREVFVKDHEKADNGDEAGTRRDEGTLRGTGDAGDDGGRNLQRGRQQQPEEKRTEADAGAGPGAASGNLRRDGPADARRLAGPTKSGRQITLQHWSGMADLNVLDPKFHGKGAIGDEKLRRDVYPDLYLARTFFGIPGYEKEWVLKDKTHRYIHRVDAGMVYDFQRDPLHLMPTTEDLEEAGFAPFDNRAAITLYERRIRDRGYLGYISRSFKAAALFGRSYVGGETPEKP